MHFKKASQPIACSAFSPSGGLYAYALSYDWSRGSESHSPSVPNQIMLHRVQKDEITQRGKKPGGRK
jgi:mRNA export factor